MQLTSLFACPFVGKAAAFPIGVAAVVGHSKGAADPTAAAPPGVDHIAADRIAKVAIEADPPGVDHTVAEVALVAIVDYP